MNAAELPKSNIDEQMLDSWQPNEPDTLWHLPAHLQNVVLARITANARILSVDKIRGFISQNDCREFLDKYAHLFHAALPPNGTEIAFGLFRSALRQLMDVSDCLIPYVEDQFPQYRIRFITKPASATIQELDFVFRKIGASTHRNEDELIVRERRLEHDALVRILASLAARYEKELQIAELPDTEKTKDFQAPFSPFSFAEAMQLFSRSNSLNNSNKLDLWKNIAGIEGDKFCKL
ncbi:MULTISPECIES: hypothetical protein [Sutterella]|uniref:hypothetical protein n=1 Tax=Sutterella TaxID=40544 RepID=UPI001F0EA6F2|nr:MULTISPECIES: hypothetical protein [Sutterella]MDR3927454.1 hypothetical protein [Sutterella sp.]